jgi:hypothetical protein
MWSRRALGSGLLALLAAACGPSGSGPPPDFPTFPDGESAAERALSDLKALITQNDFAAFGFKALTDVPLAQVDKRYLQIYDIGLDKLRTWAPGAPVDSLLALSPETLYPITVTNVPVTSVRVLQVSSGAYRPRAFGESAIMQTIAPFRQPDDVIVRVQGLGLVMLSRRMNGILMFVQLYYDARIGLQVGVGVPAEHVVLLMVPLAQQANGLPA